MDDEKKDELFVKRVHELKFITTDHLDVIPTEAALQPCIQGTPQFYKNLL
jgi:hypothetical protein